MNPDWSKMVIEIMEKLHITGYQLAQRCQVSPSAITGMKLYNAQPNWQFGNKIIKLHAKHCGAKSE